MTRTPRSLQNYIGSARHREQARRACFEINSSRAKKPKCGATNKKDGEPCKNLAMENGRCKFHGGRIPKGKGWHKHQLPDGNSRHAVARAERKLADKRRIEKSRNKRISSMTPEERQEYEKWKSAHIPGPKAERERRRLERVNNEDLRQRIANAETQPASQEVAALAAERKRLECMLRELEAVRNANQNIGVFG